ncbi:helix-turn-helix transcriptional regulator [Kribbella sp. NBC_01505]|uniref:helix-turn-helix transcriptional regulator n=1 Tax=Kribbella sp. NBC_01505 TaxID=2903580 RepID=UPI00386BE9B1
MTGQLEDDRTAVRRSPLAMAVLLLLAAEPLHPYGLRQRLVEWDKDRVVNVSQPNAIYQTIQRLQRSGLIEVHETVRHDKRPERTTFRTTERGVQLSTAWVREMLRTPAGEYPEFPAALSFLAAIPRADAVEALRERLATSEQNLAAFVAETDARVAALEDPLDPVHLIDTDYQQTMATAEIAWLRRQLAALEPRG